MSSNPIQSPKVGYVLNWMRNHSRNEAKVMFPTHWKVSKLQYINYKLLYM